MNEVIWSPTAGRVAASGMTLFVRYAARRNGLALKDSADLGDWSVSRPADFWDTLWDWLGVIGEKGPTVLEGTRFFPGARLNFAENLLGLAPPDDPETDALVYLGEDGRRDRMSWNQLRALVSRLQQAMRTAGVRPGDRVAGILPNCPEAIAAMLATASLGAVWASASPDFGARAILDRFGQIEPKLLFAVDGYSYGGKLHEAGTKLRSIVTQLASLKRTVVVDGSGQAGAVAESLCNGVTLAGFVAGAPATEPTFVRMDFDSPLYILFSSGTTGAPKCMVHRAGGVLLQHLKEHALHADIRPGDRVFYYTTLGWMMWNWLASGLGRGATLVLYDGSPFHPVPEILWNLAETEKITHFGTSPKYLDSCRKHGLSPGRSHDLGALRTVLSTGSPLVAETCRYVCTDISGDVHLMSMSGGTDIVSCFVTGDPTRPVIAGEIQCAGLGLSVEVWDDNGRPAATGTKGELVSTLAFPAMPLGFWGDETGERYRAAYFSRFPGVWCQGDYAERCPSGGYIIHGRSDATLNPGGVRIGTAEIYAEVEKFPEIRDCVVVGQDWGDDVRIVLFVSMAGGAAFDEALAQRLKSAIRTGSSPRHVPAIILAVPDIPRTRSGKVTEIAVRDAIHGRSIANVDALANPEALDHFRNLAALKT